MNTLELLAFQTNPMLEVEPTMNPILTLTLNNLELTKRFLQSVFAQDITVQPYVIDNGSTDGTQAWLTNQMPDVVSIFRDRNEGVSAGWNSGLSHIFRFAHHCVVAGNDTFLPRWFYRKLLSYNLGFVTGVAVDKMEQIAQEPPQLELQPHPDFSAFLMRRDVWERVGPFDVSMKHYASDCDMHLRAHRAGMHLYKACVPFYHERSSTLRNAPSGVREEIESQANRDRQVFMDKYGCLPGQKEYYQLFE